MIKLAFVKENSTALLYSIVLVKRTRLGPWQGNHTKNLEKRIISIRPHLHCVNSVADIRQNFMMECFISGNYFKTYF